GLEFDRSGRLYRWQLINQKAGHAVGRYQIGVTLDDKHAERWVLSPRPLQRIQGSGKSLPCRRGAEVPAAAYGAVQQPVLHIRAIAKFPSHILAERRGKHRHSPVEDWIEVDVLVPWHRHTDGCVVETEGSVLAFPVFVQELVSRHAAAVAFNQLRRKPGVVA